MGQPRPPPNRPPPPNRRLGRNSCSPLGRASAAEEVPSPAASASLTLQGARILHR